MDVTSEHHPVPPSHRLWCVRGPSACRQSVGLLSLQQNYMRCVCEAWDFSALCVTFTCCLRRRSQIIHVVSRQGAAAASACGDNRTHTHTRVRVCVCVCVCVRVHVHYASRGIVRICVCCNSLSKSKSLTAALMPAASQVMKGPLLVATDTSPLLPADGESITPSARRSVSLTPACIIKVYSPDLPAQLPPLMKKINMRWALIFHKSEGKQGAVLLAAGGRRSDSRSWRLLI